MSIHPVLSMMSESTRIRQLTIKSINSNQFEIRSVAPAMSAPCAESLATSVAISMRKVCDGRLLCHSIDMLNI